MSGRRSVDLALGAMDAFVSKLSEMKWESDKYCCQYFVKLQETDPEWANQILEGLATAKGRVIFRITLAFSYWKQLPWKLLHIMELWLNRCIT